MFMDPSLIYEVEGTDMAECLLDYAQLVRAATNWSTSGSCFA
ncbi:hypothetical protein [Cereibacter sphaeroides]|nr:hypothetical protein [Cereibacter sphaeroides]